MDSFIFLAFLDLEIYAENRVFFRRFSGYELGLDFQNWFLNSYFVISLVTLTKIVYCANSGEQN